MVNPKCSKPMGLQALGQLARTRKQLKRTWRDLLPFLHAVTYVCQLEHIALAFLHGGWSLPQRSHRLYSGGFRGLHLGLFESVGALHCPMILLPALHTYVEALVTLVPSPSGTHSKSSLCSSSAGGPTAPSAS